MGVAVFCHSCVLLDFGRIVGRHTVAAEPLFMGKLHSLEFGKLVGKIPANNSQCIAVRPHGFLT
jgi:hypothetical protein